MSETEKIRLPGIRLPATGNQITEPEDPGATLVHQFSLGGDLDWAGGLCELHCREDRCGDKGQRCTCPGHQEDGTHIVQTAVHAGIHGWLAHDGYPLHKHNPVTKSIRWAPKSELRRPGTGELSSGAPANLAFEEPGHPYPRKAALCGRWGCVLPEGHNQGQPDIPSNHRNDRQAREGRCPDGGYCHGSTIAAGSPPCAPGLCWRVQTSGPLSGVFPGDRWPPGVIAAARTHTGTEACPLRPLHDPCHTGCSEDGRTEADLTVAGLLAAWRAMITGTTIPVPVPRDPEPSG